MKELLEIDKIVNQKVESMINSGAISKIIEDKIESTITEAIDNELRSYSDFGKNLKTYINKSLQVDFERLGFEGYHENLLRVIGKVYANSMESVHLDKVKKLTEEMLANPPEIVKFSELVEAVKEKAIEHARENSEDYHHGYDGNITCEITDRDDRFFTYINLDPEEGKSSYDCAFRIGISKTGEKDEIFSVRIKGDGSSDLFVQNTYGLERLLFKAKCASSEFEFDIDDPDTSYSV